MTSLSGVAYGFDACGKPAAAEQGRRERSSRSSRRRPLEPGKKATVARGAQGRRGRDARHRARSTERRAPTERAGRGNDRSARRRRRASASRSRSRSALAASACSKTHRYESAVQIVRKEIVEKDDERRRACRSTSRSSGTRARAISSRSSAAARPSPSAPRSTTSATTVPVYVRHWWDERGFYRWDIERMGDCWRAIEPDSRRLLREGPGVQGRREPRVQVRASRAAASRSAQLVKRCPWMARE